MFKGRCKAFATGKEAPLRETVPLELSLFDKQVQFGIKFAIHTQSQSSTRATHHFQLAAGLIEGAQKIRHGFAGGIRADLEGDEALCCLNMNGIHRGPGRDRIINPLIPIFPTLNQSLKLAHPAFLQFSQSLPHLIWMKPLGSIIQDFMGIGDAGSGDNGGD
jgi:hypothetical protein